MHHDIKSFLDLLVTKEQLTVSVSIKIHGHVIGYVEFNGKRCYEGVNEFKVELYDLLTLQSTISQYIEGTSAIEITDLTVNGYNVIPKYQHLSSSGNAYHDYIGTWELSTNEPFYVWYHKISGQGWIA